MNDIINNNLMTEIKHDNESYEDFYERMRECERNEFRFNKKNKHPAHIYQEESGFFKYLGITHAPSTKGRQNIKMSCNPNPKDKENAYFRPSASKDKIRNFGAIKTGWVLSDNDDDKMKPYRT